MITTTSLPTGSTMVPYSQQLVATGGIAPYTWTIPTGTLPAGLSLSPGGLIAGTPTTNGPPMIFTVQVTDSEPTTSPAQATLSITILSITTTSLPAATINQPYSATLTASGGIPKYTWCVLESSGTCDTGAASLPPGLTLSPTGTISGTPTKLGMFPFTAEVRDSQKNFAFVTAPFTITVQFVITTTVLPQGTVSLPYSFTLMASGGNPPYMWTITSGSLPAGLSLDSSSGVISGTPTSAGTSSFMVQVKDS